MKLLRREIDSKTSTGSVAIIPEDPEDLWSLYNLIAVGDIITASTFRKVQKEMSMGSMESTKQKLTIALAVEGIQFDPSSGELRLNGKNTTESPHIRMGAYHTHELALNRKLIITKAHWDSIALSTLEEACNPSARADVSAVIISEGLAHFCLITENRTLFRAKIETAIPRKRKASVSGHDKSLEKFFESVMQNLQLHINFEVVKCVILAGPGFTKDQFFDFMMREAQRREIKLILDNKTKFIRCQASTGHKHALKEIMSNEIVAVQLADTKAAQEVKLINEFYDMLKKESDRAIYGLSHVKYAISQNAVDALLIADDLFRAQTIQKRKLYVSLVESVKESGGDVRIFSTLHFSGEQLRLIGGVACILRFPIPDIEDHVDGDSKDQSEDENEENQGKNEI
eukprot:TRINITY_DN13441_c0_g1_i1.p1 TRINITY_DN13441_c0_g1~~TRINITY_DN13441_c0_g1_i1.p1  ORF type:complete len:400 (+),score=178.16 TRINITY_DN13441_c0_g1_i1:11-1210(+)